VQASYSWTDPATSLQTSLTMWFERDLDMKPGGAGTFKDFEVVMMDVRDPSTQTDVAGFNQSLGSANTPLFTLTVAGNSATLAGTFVLTNESTEGTETLTMNLHWMLGHGSVERSNSQLELTGDSAQLSTATIIGATATGGGTFAWTSVESALQGRLPGSATVGAKDGTSSYQITDAQTVALPSGMNLGPLIQSLMPPERLPANSVADFGTERTAHALSDTSSNSVDSIVVTDGAKRIPTPPVSGSSGGSYTLNRPGYLTFGGFQGGVTVGADGREADADATVPTMTWGPDGYETSAMLAINLHWQWNGDPPETVMCKETLYNSDNIQTVYNQSVSYPATVSGSVTSDYPQFEEPVFVSAYVGFDSSIQITTPLGTSNVPPNSLGGPITQKDWQSTVLQPWRDTLGVLATIAGTHLERRSLLIPIRWSARQTFGRLHAMERLLISSTGTPPQKHVSILQDSPVEWAASFH
jgi:hypothetical protein